ncbi:structural protein P5 [Pseudomonas sp. NPDC078416]|uniref:structural protein P5 n=1 Tax=Pseudomonas sp. NPDC078416 TaxID=3390637 RepID=UPI003D0015D7
MPPATRGFRNNNPGNIDYNPRNQWQGQLPPDPLIEKRFARFDTPENGIRALAKLVLAYRGKDGMPKIGGQGIDTVREVINRWAPGVENDTESYIQAVAAGVGVQANQPIDLRNFRTLIAITTGIIKHENGAVPYPADVIAVGVQKALS